MLNIPTTVSRSEHDNPDHQSAPPPYSAVADMPAPSAPPAQYVMPYPASTPDVVRSSEYDNYGSIPSSPVNPHMGPSGGSQVSLNPHVPFDFDVVGRPLVEPRTPLPPPVPYTPDRLRRRRQRRGCCATYCTWSCFVFLLFVVVLKLSVTFAPKCSYRSTYESEKVGLNDVDDLSIEVTGIPSSGSWINFFTEENAYFQTKVLSPNDDPNVKWTIANRKAVLKINVGEIYFTPCVAVQVTVSLPKELQHLSVNTIDTTINFLKGGSKIDDINIVTKNAHIVNAGKFESKRWYLRTSNARIEGTFIADIVDLGTSNNDINVKVLNATTVNLVTSNGRISGTVEGRDVVTLSTRNAALNLDSITGRDITLTTSNGKINVAKLDVEHQFKATTSNLQINVSVLRAGADANIETKTSNSHNTLSLSNRYGAHFNLLTSNAAATLVAREGDVEYDLNTKSHKEGNKRTQGGSDGNLNVSLQTSNGPCELRFL